MFSHAIIRVLRPATLVVCLAGAAACGKYDPGEPSDDSEDAGTAGRGGRGGTGGRPTVQAGRQAPAPTVRCGSMTCPAPQNLLATLPIPTGLPTPVACCVDEASSQCGTAAMQGATCEPPAVPDARCPGIDLGRFGMMGGMTPAEPMSGCCIDDECGLDGALFGRGCIENDLARTTLAAIPFIGGFITVPPAQACSDGVADAGVEDDAGR